MILMFLSFAILLALGLPAAFAMGTSGLLGLMTINGVAPVVIPQKIFAALNSFPLLAVPLFVLVGEIMNTGGITRRIVAFCNAWLRHVRGSLSHSNIVVSMLMAGFSGSATADAVSVGAIMIPAMVEDGYSPEYSAGVTAASSCIGPIIPPSIIMVVYGGITGLSIGSLFLGGIVPGILIGVAQMVVTVIYGKKLGWPKKPKASRKEKWETTKEASWALFAPVIIIGSLMNGICTATEAATIAVMYCLFVSIVIYKDLSIKDIPAVLKRAAQNTAIPCLIISFAGLFGFVLTRENFAKMLVENMFSISQNPHVVMLLVIILLMIVGLFVDGTVALITFAPILFPIGDMMGFAPVHFALIILMVIMIGTITPPVGLQLYVAANIAKVPITKVVIWPFVISMLVIVFACAYFPPLVTFVPNLLG